MNTNIGKTYTVGNNFTVEYIKTVVVNGISFEIRKIPSYGNISEHYNAFILDYKNNELISTSVKAGDVAGVEDLLKYYVMNFKFVNKFKNRR